MARTKAEVRAFLDSKVGTIVPEKTTPSLNGQCVTLVKALMEFLGVPNPYAARGNAITAGDAYLAQNLGESGKGWLTIVVNRDMGYIGGVRYGHIWVDLKDEANYESNGARALYTTKNTRPISQGQQFINFDKWIGEDFVIETSKPIFNARYYLNNNPDVNKDYKVPNAHKHWLENGIKEGRPSAPNFHVKEYLANYGDLRKAYGTKGYARAVRHYFDHGINEGRSGRTLKPAAPSTPAKVDKAVVVDYISKNLK